MKKDNDSTDKSFVLKGTKNFMVKLKDNSGKEPETATLRNFDYNNPNKISYWKKRYNHPYRGRQTLFYNNRRRQRGLWSRRRGFKIIIRNLAKEVTNYDIKSVFEKIGPINQCGIIWNNRYGNKNIAEVEYVYLLDAFRAFRKLDYKSVKGIPIRIEIKDMSKNTYFGRRASYADYRNFFSRNLPKRIGKIDARRRRSFHHSKNIDKSAMRFWKRRRI